MAKVTGLLFLFFSNLLWSNTLCNDSISSLIPHNFTGQIAIKEKNTFIFKENYGPKERVFGTMINDSTVFNIGQISQTIIYYIFENLFNTGRLQPKDKVNKYINTFPYENIQIEHLLKHQSGLPHLYAKLYHRKVYNNWNLKLSERSVRFNNTDILKILAKEKPKLNFVPGDSFAYSDLNYLVLSSLIEKITNTSFSNYVNTIFETMPLIRGIVSASTDTILNKAYGYRLFSDSIFQLCDNLKTRGLPFDDGTFGNQHIYLSASNLADWGQFIFSKIDINLIKKTPDKEIMGGIKYDPIRNIVSKNGFFGGTSSKLIFIPENNLVLAINSAILNSLSKETTFNSLIDYLKSLN
tara:strand:+ start:2207 stop:3265 length:1059 start_codon:yes stop_codon:yes gene_type:complete